MPFDTGDGVDCNSFGHVTSPSRRKLGMPSRRQHWKSFDEIEVGHKFDGHESQGDQYFRHGGEIMPPGAGVKSDEKSVEPVQRTCQEQGAGTQEKEAQV